jgi:hypothetical protein
MTTWALMPLAFSWFARAIRLKSYLIWIGTAPFSNWSAFRHVFSQFPPKISGPQPPGVTGRGHLDEPVERSIRPEKPAFAVGMPVRDHQIAAVLSDEQSQERQPAQTIRDVWRLRDVDLREPDHRPAVKVRPDFVDLSHRDGAQARAKGIRLDSPGHDFRDRRRSANRLTEFIE